MCFSTAQEEIMLVYNGFYTSTATVNLYNAQGMPYMCQGSCSQGPAIMHVLQSGLQEEFMQ